MIITLTRWDMTNERSIGTLSMPGFECFSLEDTDRGLKKGMLLERIMASKVYGKTAIPYGDYEIVVSYSNKFKKMLPLLLDVPGFSGIRIHSLNTALETEGCIGPGLGRTENTITDSREAMKKVMAIIMTFLKKEKVFIKVTWDGAQLASRSLTLGKPTPF